MIILLFMCNYCFAQTLNYSVNSGSENKNIDNIKINYVVGEPIAVSFNLTNISIADLIDTTNGIYQYKNFHLTLFPNPSTHYITLSLPITDDYEIDLLDNVGSHIANIYKGNIESNIGNTIELTKFNLICGSYLLHIKSEKINTLLNFIILK